MLKKNNAIALKVVLLVLAILTIDQTSKIYVKTHFTLGEKFPVFDWFQVFFTENPGLAFGFEFGGKLFLTLFRIIAVSILIYYISRLIKNNARQGFILTIATVLAGAAGNIIDSVFYGIFFSESTFESAAQFMPTGGGYAPLFYGKVVDMLSFHIFTFPDWLPFLGGEVFFSPIFNIADSAITTALFLVIIFFLKDLNTSLETKKNLVADEES
jgi:signal peptidase II